MRVYNMRIASILRIFDKWREPAVLNNKITVLLSCNRTILLLVLCADRGDEKCDRKPRVVGIIERGVGMCLSSKILALALHSVVPARVHRLPYYWCYSTWTEFTMTWSYVPSRGVDYCDRIICKGQRFIFGTHPPLKNW
jgi:hypothetical protein